MLKAEGYTLVEILVVLVIIGVLIVLGWPNYLKIKEVTLNREAKASLALISAADKIYKMEQTFYYPYSTSENSPANINTNLKLSLPTAPPSWSITVDSTTPGSEKATAKRSIGAGADNRVWTQLFSSDTPTCAGGSYCQ
jgi:prepilin-type N-terminal cleavage/methylation domain-containing protein